MFIQRTNPAPRGMAGLGCNYSSEPSGLAGAGMGCPPGAGKGGAMGHQGMHGLPNRRGMGEAMKTNNDVASKKPQVQAAIDGALAQVQQANSQIASAQGPVQASGVSAAMTDLQGIAGAVQQADIQLRTLKSQVDGIATQYGSFDASNNAWLQLDRLEQQAAPVVASIAGAGQKALSILQSAQAASARASQASQAQAAADAQAQAAAQAQAQSKNAMRARTTVVSAINQAQIAAASGDFDTAASVLSSASVTQAAIDSDMVGDIQAAIAGIAAAKRSASTASARDAASAAQLASDRAAAVANEKAMRDAQAAAQAQAQAQSTAQIQAQIDAQNRAAQIAADKELRLAQMQADQSRAQQAAADRAASLAAQDRKAALQAEADQRQTAALAQLASGSSPIAQVASVGLLKRLLGGDFAALFGGGAQGGAPGLVSGMPGPTGQTYLPQYSARSGDERF